MVNDLATGGEELLKHFRVADFEQARRAGVMRGPEAYANRPVAAVTLIEPVDQYTMSDRAVRYGFLIVMLTLCIVLLFELLKGVRVHPMQYLLAGLAITIFFLLLFALSEHIAFVNAYVIAAASCVLLLMYYASFMLETVLRGLGFGLGVALLYALMYVLLMLEDTAFLVGAVVQFIAIATAMIATRKLDWFAIGTRPAESNAASS